MSTTNLILGITGNIASGKSTVARVFADLGAALLDADQLARMVVEPGSPVLQQLVDRFGEQVRQENGRLDRELLGQLVFSDTAARKDLNRIMHPAIGRLAVERLQLLKCKPDIPLVIYEAPLLFEANAEDRVDRVLVVKIDPETQLRRLMQRDRLSETEARQRIAAQMPQAQKLARADYVIDNSGSLAAAKRQVMALWQKLVAERD